LLLAELNQRKGEDERSLGNLQRALKYVQRSEDIMEAYILLAHAYAMLNRSEEAQEHLKIAKSSSESKERFFRRLQELREERAEYHATAWRGALAAEPGNESVRLRLAALLRRKGDTDQATEILRVQMASQSGRKKRAVELSFCLAEKGELLTAVEVLSAIAVKNPADEDDLAVLYALAILHRNMENHLSAVAVLKTIRRADPGYREVQTLLRQEYEALILQDYGVSERVIPSRLAQSS
jgi:tetratricopeptide (TPR) repeat protein